ncbi:unnamed protein product, partial [Owenia fusiformis]
YTPVSKISKLLISFTNETITQIISTHIVQNPTEFKMGIPRYLLPFSIVGSAVGGVVILRELMGGPRYKATERVPGKTFIVTGANTGIGKYTAMELARLGGKVIMACRNPESEQAKRTRFDIIDTTHNRNVHLKKLDLASLKSIQEFAEEINKEEDKLDVLINNAGVMRCPKLLTEDGFEMQLGVNHLGHFLLTNLLLEKLKTSAPSRVVTLSSVAHERGEINFDDLNSSKTYHPARAYEQSKLANAMFAIELAKRLEGTGVTSNAVHPGIVNTEIGRHMKVNKSYIAWPIIGPIKFLFLKSPEQGAQTSLFCALDSSLENVTGKYFKNCAESHFVESAKNAADSKRLWAISERWTRLVDPTTEKSKTEATDTKKDSDSKKS